MTDTKDPKANSSSPKDARAARRKAELKANMARRKAQARMRGAADGAVDSRADIGKLGNQAHGLPDVTEN